MNDRIETGTAVEFAIWEHLDLIGPAGTWTAYQACRAWLETHGYRERPEADECDCDEAEVDQ